MAYDFNALKAQNNIMYFSEEFEVSMFYIIEFLARRRAYKTDNQMFYMNQYLTVDSECGTFKLAPDLLPLKPVTQEMMQKENEIFKNMSVKYEPDFSVDAVIDTLIEKILSKIKK